MNTYHFFLLVLIVTLSLNLQAQPNDAIITQSTSLRMEASSKSKTILRLTSNDQLTLLNDCNNYYCKVEFNGTIGWVKKHLIKNINIESKETVQEVQEEDSFINESSISEEVPLEDVSEKTLLKEISSEDSPNNKQTSFYILIYITIFSFLLIIGLLYYAYRITTQRQVLDNELNKTKAKHQGINDVQEYIEEQKRDYQNVASRLNKQIEELQVSRQELKKKHKQEEKIHHKLKQEINLLKSDLDIIEYGVYEPQFDYDTSAIFKLHITEIRSTQKQMIKADSAVIGGEHWTVNGSTSKGRVMINKQKKLMLRAFNGECNSFIAGVKWNNETRMEERILKSTEMINKLGDAQGLKISTKYTEAKLQELRLTYEYQLKKQEEKEQQRQIREQIREEEKARKDFEKAQKEAEREEKILQKAMEQARTQIAKASETEKAIFEARLVELKEKLKVAEEKNQRAISMAQQTRAGHVYVISNIGSFGKNVYKIGMTRRLEPMDRIYELGDASVPFRFDVHAMIYSEDAPNLEKQLHAKFDQYRLNHVNRRREYFNISLNEIEKVVKENHGEIEFIIEPEAKEYRESLVIIEQMAKPKKTNTVKPNIEFTNESFN